MSKRKFRYKRKEKRKEIWNDFRTNREKKNDAYEKRAKYQRDISANRAKLFKNRLVREATPAEKLLVERLKSEYIVFRFQEPVHSTHHFRIVDFWVSRLNNTPLVIEIDGSYHEEEEQKWDDKKREEWLKEMTGCEIIRFTNQEIYTDLENVIAKIKGKHVLVQFST